MANYDEKSVWELMDKASSLMEEFINVTGLEYDWDENEYFCRKMPEIEMDREYADAVLLLGQDYR